MKTFYECTFTFTDITNTIVFPLGQRKGTIFSKSNSSWYINLSHRSDTKVQFICHQNIIKDIISVVYYLVVALDTYILRNASIIKQFQRMTYPPLI